MKHRQEAKSKYFIQNKISEEKWLQKHWTKKKNHICFDLFV